MSGWINRTLSKVEIQQQIGRGGMAEVYLGRHTTLNRPVAVKILYAHLSKDATLLSRFRSEAQAVAGLRHPNIVQVYDFDLADGDQPYIIMELLEGPSLQAHLEVLRNRDQRLPPETIVRLLKALASAVDYAHARKIVHRDIKPANVILHSETTTIVPGEPLPNDVDLVLTDFGIAQMANADVQTASGTIIGTPAYMSPEQVRGEGIDHRTDIYSLGIMLYEMLAGRVPFEADTQASVLVQQLTETPPPLDGVTYEVQDIIDKVLAKDPARRFQTASQLADALQQIYQGGAGAGMLATGVLSQPGTEEQSTVQLHGTAAAAETVSPSETQVSGGRSGLAPMWIAAGLGGLALIIAIAALIIVGGALTRQSADVTSTEAPVVQPTLEDQAEPTALVADAPTSLLPDPTQAPTPSTEASVDTDLPRGTVTFRDATVSAAFTELQPPADNSVYEAWLVSSQSEPLSLGDLTVNDGQSRLSFTEADGSILLVDYEGLIISLEPVPDDDPSMSEAIIYRAEVPPDLLDHIRNLYDYTLRRDAPFDGMLLDGAIFQATQYDNHLGFAVEGINGGDLNAGKLHSEHVINIISGANSEEYGDWNQDDLTQNPGDDVGLEPYLLLIEDTLSSVVLTTDDEGVREQAASLQAETDTLLQKVQDARRQAQRITASDNLAEASDLAVTLDTLRVEGTLASLVESIQTLDLGITVEVFAVGS
jgi:serine/threonine-protein kinase